MCVIIIDLLEGSTRSDLENNGALFWTEECITSFPCI
jgi:hypothetical protein